MKLKKRVTTFWGKKYEIRPELIEKKYGDGKQLMYLSFTDMRPNYYLIWIDSAIDLDDADNNTVDLYEFLEQDVMVEIGEQYGSYNRNKDNIDDFDFPQLIDIGSGYCFGRVDSDDDEYVECVECVERVKK